MEKGWGAARTAGVVAAALAIGAPVTAAQAGGLDTSPEVGAEQLGRGAAWLAKADDPIAAYMNPAAMSFQSNGVSIGAHLIFQSQCFTRRSTGNMPVSPGSALPAPGTADGPTEPTCADNFLPNPQIAAVFKPTHRFAIGIAVLAPHSAGSPTWPETVSYVRNGVTRQEPAPQRYLAVDASTAIVLNPTLSFSYAITHNFSLGAGFVWGIATVDFTTMTEALSPSAQDDFFGHQDVKAHISAKDLFVPGFVIGAEWSPSSRVDLAAWYRYSDEIRSNVDLTLTSSNYLAGGAPNTNPCQGQAANCNVTTAPAAGAIQIPVPMEAKLGVRYHQPLSTRVERPGWAAHKPLIKDSLSQDRFDIEGDFTWSNDSAFDQIQLRFGSEACRNDPKCTNSGIPVKGTPGQVPVNGDIPHLWRDVLGIRIGSDVTAIPNRLALRLGGYFESKGQRDEYLNLDFDRSFKVGLTLGGTVRVGPADLHLAFAHTFFGTLDNNGTGAVRALSGDATSGYRSQQAVNGGSLTASVNEVAAAATFRF